MTIWLLKADHSYQGTMILMFLIILDAIRQYGPYSIAGVGQGVQIVAMSLINQRKIEKPKCPKYDSLATAFWCHVIKGETEDDCWSWINSQGYYKGYGSFVFGGKYYKGHRLSYEMFNGPIPDGLFVLHKCDNPPCCNPRHLFVGTYKDNTQDMARKGRGRKPASYYKNRADRSR